MRERLLLLAQRRARLAVQAQSERAVLLHAIEPADAAAVALAGLLATARRAADEARRRPALVLAAVALLVALRPRRALAWAARGWSAWRLYRGAFRWWRRVASAGTPAAPVR
jgi:hypothetical protein